MAGGPSATRRACAQVGGGHGDRGMTRWQKALQLLATQLLPLVIADLAAVGKKQEEGFLFLTTHIKTAARWEEEGVGRR